MQNIKKYINWRNYKIILTALSLLLVGCGSDVATDSANSSVEAVVEETTITEEIQVTVVESSNAEEAVIEETVVEETVEEKEIELYIPEGIDMESTLPGEEWVASFIGKVTEPVVVIYNDNTGRKEVVQNGSKVTVNPDEDIFGVYLVDSANGRHTYEIDIKDLVMTDYYHLMIMDPQKMRANPERNAEVYVLGAVGEWKNEFTILVE